jgi:outer membrane protein OmpA-like peptidoglycan-associated protein
MRRGVDAVRLTTSGRGKANPKVANRQAGDSDNAAGRQENRRVEVAIAK